MQQILIGLKQRVTIRNIRNIFLKADMKLFLTHLRFWKVHCYCIRIKKSLDPVLPRNFISAHLLPL